MFQMANTFPAIKIPPFLPSNACKFSRLAGFLIPSTIQPIGINMQKECAGKHGYLSKLVDNASMVTLNYAQQRIVNCPIT